MEKLYALHTGNQATSFLELGCAPDSNSSMFATCHIAERQICHWPNEDKTYVHLQLRSGKSRN